MPAFEKMMVESGIILFKYWLEVSPEEQTRRLEQRIDGRAEKSGSCPRWISNPTAAGMITRGRATKCFLRPDTPWAPWFVARSDDKKRTRLNIIKHLLGRIPYEDPPRKKVKLPDRQKPEGYKEPNYPFKWVEEPF